MASSDSTIQDPGRPVRLLAIPNDLWDEFVSVVAAHGIDLRDTTGRSRDFRAVRA